ncbi:DNA sulfur modification protein DndE [Lewinella marina]|uniref:GntR family transcriptional regulator n=1 Tax=Neolewinella marina TaxID=438751 RepID=A0A2G0CIW4_9BACT|nr:rhamnogalacturonan acetylesterase [Neolewinella marina]NJB84983.1 DNA sulfur modification protein DndE [Neolewinella marina]PHK99867.1 GntR family transcriptional regulator [Neolewinella marina]
MHFSSFLIRLTGFILVAAVVVGCRSLPATPPTVYLIGDSTAADKREDRRPETGWGEALSDYLTAGVVVENHARNGRSSRSFRQEGLWRIVYEAIRPGDYVFIQFGHNDPKPDTSRFSSPEDYGDNLKRYVEETRERGGRAVILSPIVRRKFDAAGVLQPTHEAYPATARRVAREMKVPFIDMTTLSRDLISGYGDAPSQALFLWLEAGEHPNYPEGVEDNTHLSPAGARAIAGLVARGIREARLPLRRQLVGK